MSDRRSQSRSAIARHGIGKTARTPRVFQGEIFFIGFSSRKNDISVYGTGSAASREKLLPLLGKHKTGKGCLYIRALQDIDLTVLERLFAETIGAKKK